MADKHEGFEVVDKRRVAADGNEAEKPAKTEEAQARATEAEAEEPVAEGEETNLPDMDIYVLLSSMIGMLHGFAWQKMGFVASRVTGKVEEDLPQAKIAIDTVQFLAQKLEGGVSEAETRELRRMVMDLQMNYLRKTSSGS